MLLHLYKFLSIIGAPIIDSYLFKRKALGKEDKERLPERLGVASITRPKGKLVWLHAASVGEALSILPLMKAITEQYPKLNLLLTTGTVTSAQMMKTRLPDRCYHQYIPIDRYFAVRRFLKFWQPDLALWVESEIWPNLLSETQKYCPMVLVNGRLSPRSLQKWRRYPKLAATLMGYFTLVLPQSENDSKRLKELGAKEVQFLGNLKYDSPSLPSDSKKMGALVTMIGDRHVWVCASTHPGEELMIADVHEKLKEHYKHLLTIIVPRHPDRAEEIIDELKEKHPGISIAQRSVGDAIHDETDIYLADAMGELGVFYRLAPIVFVGGSLIEHGGQNPLEPARLESAILFGPFMNNFKDIASELQEKGGAIRVADSSALAEALDGLMRDTDQQQQLAESAKKIATEKKGVLDAYMEALKPNLEYLSKQG